MLAFLERKKIFREVLQLNDGPKITVVMPVYNDELYLRQSIDSILNQSYSNFEFIIINDCSTDATPLIVQSYEDKRIKIISNPINKGIPESLNLGFSIAKVCL